MLSLGVIAYNLLMGLNGENTKKLFEVTMQGNFSFKGDPWNTISTDAKDFIIKLLKQDQWESMMSASEALEHEWLK